MSIKKSLKHFWKKTKREARIIWKNLGKVRHKKSHALLAVLTLFFLFAGALTLWISTFTIPNLDSFANRKVSQSTKIYDRTGKTLLYDLNQGIKRTIVAPNEISDNIKKATVSIEDVNFYTHHGVEPLAILRAILDNLKAGCITCGQGGSTITQQVIKNSLLTSDRALSRKIKEWVLAWKIEKIMPKEEILALYLNESPFGGQIYGVEEASSAYYAKHASELTIAESAYLAAMLQAPTHYSPYGKYQGELESRQKLVLRRMYEEKNITKAEYDAAVAEKVAFQPQQTSGFLAPHFVTYVIDKLHDYYDEGELEQGGLRIITTLDYALESKAETLVKQYALQNEKDFKAENAALVAIEPKTGNILTMVGSRDYFDKDIDGNFNVATAKRQPGSTFKPIVYATAFTMGYEPETILFDAPTEFSTNCPPEAALLTSGTSAAGCYHPQDFDNVFLGPMDIRHALAQSRNIPAIKMLYLVGINNALRTARNMGITSLSSQGNYGLTLVLGGGEVSPLELTSAYSTFPNNGVHIPYNSILRIEDKDGKVLRDFSLENKGVQVMPKQAALKINDVLSDYPAKDPNELLHFPNQDVAAKTGTTNDFKDAWIMGFSPNIAVGVWTGNNDNTAMEKKVAGYIAAPLWNAFMKAALAARPVESFEEPTPTDISSLKPVLRGAWQGTSSYYVDKVTGNLATAFTPPSQIEERFTGGVHDILYSVDKSDPLGPAPANPGNDPQYPRWEFGVQTWLLQHPEYNITQYGPIPVASDDVHSPSNSPVVGILNPNPSIDYAPTDRITIQISHTERYPIAKVDYYINGSYLGQSGQTPFSLSFVPRDLPNIQALNTLRAVVTDSIGNAGENSMQFKVGQ